MATPAEIVRRWKLREAREAAVSRARNTAANDNVPREPDGHIIVDGEPMAFWLAHLIEAIEIEVRIA